MGENLDNYKVTPEDLGCLGEKEIDDGVKEENTVETKVPIPKSFEHIPFAAKKRARKIYDDFEKKDMSFEEFCIELYAVESPALMKRDLAEIIEGKHDRNRMQAANTHMIKQSMN